MPRNHDTWLRYQVEYYIKNTHPELEKILRRKRRRALWDFIAEKKNWWCVVAMSIGIYAFGFLLFVLLGVGENSGDLITQRASNLSTISGMSLAVVVFLISNIAVKEPYAYEQVIKRMKIYPYLFFILTTLFILIILSIAKSTKPSLIEKQLAYAGSFVFILVLIAIGLLFANAFTFFNASKIDGLMNKELEERAIAVVKFGLLKSYSRLGIFNLMKRHGVEQYYGSTFMSERVLGSIRGLMLLDGRQNDEQEEDEPEDVQCYLEDVNMHGLDYWLRMHASQSMHFHNLTLNEEASTQARFIVADDWDLSDVEIKQLKKLLYFYRKTPKSQDSVKEIRQHFDDKMVEYAESGKAKELQRILDGLNILYDLQMKHRPEGDDSLIQDLFLSIDEAFRETIRKAHYRCFKKLMHFSRLNTELSLSALDISVYKSLIGLQQTYYSSLANKTAKAEYEQFQHDVDTSPYYELLLGTLAMDNRRKTGDIPLVNLFIYQTFLGLNQLIFYMIYYKDFARFRQAAKVLDRQLFEGADYRLTNEIRVLKNKHRNAAEERTLIALEGQYSESKKPQRYHRHVAFSLKAWVFHMHLNKKLTQEETAKFANAIHLPYQDFEKPIHDLFLFRSGRIDYFNWFNWQLPKSDEEDQKFENSYAWFTFGFFVQQLINEHLPIFSDQIVVEKLHDISLVVEDFKGVKQTLLDKFDDWNIVLRVNSREQLTEKADRIIGLFERLVLKQQTEQARNLAETELVEELVEKFVTSVQETWQSQAHVYEIFSKLGNPIPTGQNPNLPFIGYDRIEEQAKLYFVEDNFPYSRHPYRDAGSIAGQRFDSEFFEKVFGNIAPKLTNNSIVKLLEEGLKKLTAAGFNADCIIVPPKFSSIDDQFLEDRRFKNNYEVNADFSTEALMGTFNDIPVFRSDSPLLQNQIIIAKFDDAFGMNYLTNAGYFENILKITAEAVTTEEAEHIFSIRFQVQAEQKAQIINRLRSGVRLVVGVNAQFNIKNENACVIGMVISDDTTH